MEKITKATFKVNSPADGYADSVKGSNHKKKKETKQHKDEEEVWKECPCVKWSGTRFKWIVFRFVFVGRCCWLKGKKVLLVFKIYCYHHLVAFLSLMFSSHKAGRLLTWEELKHESLIFVVLESTYARDLKKYGSWLFSSRTQHNSTHWLKLQFIIVELYEKKQSQHLKKYLAI